MAAHESKASTAEGSDAERGADAASKRQADGGVFACNIDARGKAARLISGILCCLAAAGIGLAAALGWLPFWTWYLAGGLLVGGAFQVYEGWAGWCVMRAMGFRTPM